MKINKMNFITAFISAIVFIAGYIICTLFFSKVPTFSYTAEWAASHYFLFIWVVTILLAIFNKPYASLITTAGCFIGIVLGDIIGQNIINNNWKEIDKLLAEGVNVGVETLNQADYHKGVFIWIGTIFIFLIIGIVIDILYKKSKKPLH